MESKDAKICPLLLQARGMDPGLLEAWGRDPGLNIVSGLNIACIGKTCALYVNAQKISPLGSVMVWEGCGLVHQVAWKFLKPEKKQ